jgi:hypothetical protein
MLLTGATQPLLPGAVPLATKLLIAILQLLQLKINKKPRCLERGL